MKKEIKYKSATQRPLKRVEPRGHKKSKRECIGNR